MTETESMVVRVARALCLADGRDPDSDFRMKEDVVLSVAVKDPELWRTYRAKARAAIEAMFEPSSEMLSSGDAALQRCDLGWEANAAYRAMIDKALEE